MSALFWNENQCREIAMKPFKCSRCGHFYAKPVMVIIQPDRCPACREVNWTIVESKTTMDEPKEIEYDEEE